MASAFLRKVFDIVTNGNTYFDLDNEDKVALTALKLKELPNRHKHEFFTDSTDSDELLDKLIDYLCAWNLPREQKDIKRVAFEELLEQVVINYDTKNTLAIFSSATGLTGAREDDEYDARRDLRDNSGFKFN
jgi:hypothetical protein